MKRIHDLTRLGWRIPYFTWALRNEKPRTFNRDFPVKMRRVSFAGSTLAFEWAARCAGVAVVHDGGQQAELYGRTCNMDMLMEFWPKDTYPEAQLLESVFWTEHWVQVNGIDTYGSDRRMAEYAEWDARRIALNKVQHRVAGEHPEFRVWDAPRGPNLPEVVLVPYTPGGLHLGGCVWSKDTYLAQSKQVLTGWHQK